MSDHEEEEASLPGDAASVDKEGDAASAGGDTASAADTETQKDRTELSQSSAAGPRNFAQRMQDARDSKSKSKAGGAARALNMRAVGRSNAGKKRSADEAGGDRKRRAADETGGDRDEREQEGAGKTAQRKLKLTLPIHKFHKALRRQSHTKRVGTSSAVILTSIIEYVTSEILELAGNTAKECHKNRIIPKHIQQAVRTDEELNKYLANVTIAGGGVVPQVHATALPKKEKPAKARQPAAASGGVIADSGSQVY